MGLLLRPPRREFCQVRGQGVNTNPLHRNGVEVGGLPQLVVKLRPQSYLDKNGGDGSRAVQFLASWP